MPVVQGREAVPGYVTIAAVLYNGQSDRRRHENFPPRRSAGLSLLAATPVIRQLLALLLCLFSGGLAIYGYLRWLRNEKAMRLKEDLPYTHSLLLVSLILMIVAVIVMGLVLYGG